jgi:hypothetical protein
VLRFKKNDGRVLIHDAFVTKNQFVRSQLRPLASLIRIPLKRFVIEDDQRSAGIRIIEQLLISRN